MDPGVARSLKLLVTDLRTQVLPRLICVDASSSWMAEVSAELPQVFADELTRHKLTKAAWSRLLSPWKEVQRLHSSLSQEDEVPDGEQPACCTPGLECAGTGLLISDRVEAAGQEEETHQFIGVGSSWEPW